MLVSVCGHQISLNITIWSLYVGSCERSDLSESPSNSAIWSTADKVRQRNGKLWPVGRLQPSDTSLTRCWRHWLSLYSASPDSSLTLWETVCDHDGFTIPSLSARHLKQTLNLQRSTDYRLRRNRLGYAWMAVTIYLHLKYLTKQVQGLKLEHSRNVQQIFSPLTVHTTQLSENL